MREEGLQEELLVLKWMAEDHKEIKKLAQKIGAEIYFGDESMIRPLFTPYLLIISDLFNLFPFTC